MSSKTKWSNFHVTINLNETTSKSSARGTITGFANAIDSMINDDVFGWLVRYDNGQRPFREEEKHLVDRVRARVGLERDDEGTNRSLHAHVLMEVEHRTMVQIDKWNIQHFINDRLGVRSNVHVRFLQGNSSDKDFILKYITKSMRDGAGSGQNRRLAKAMGRGASGVLQPADNDEVY